MKHLALLLVLAVKLCAIDADKQAFINLEMANYFFQGKDLDNALKYYTMADGKVKPDELSVLICRNIAMIHMIKENKPKAVTTLENCIKGNKVELMESSQAFRDVVKMYAEIKADEINPKIQAGKREAFEAQQRAVMQRSAPQTPAQKPASKPAPAKGDDQKVKIGF